MLDYGSYWHDKPISRQNGEFDCVVKRKGDVYEFFECKYYDRKMTLAVCRQEEAQARRQTGLKISRLGFVCTGGFDFGAEAGYILIDGETLYR